MTTQTSTTESTSSTTPIILLLSLNKADFWDEQHTALVDTLSSKASLKRVSNPSSAVTYLTNNNPSAIIITDAALTDRKSQFNGIREKVVNYVRGGGKAVIATHFTSFVRPSDSNHWFRTSWSLPWESGDYHRTTVYLNSSFGGERLNQRGLPASYSQKAVHLKNVARGDALYLPSSESRTESHVFSPTPVDTQQTPVVFAKVGEGYLGYVGDVNNETESQAVIVTMCGL